MLFHLVEPPRCIDIDGTIRDNEARVLGVVQSSGTPQTDITINIKLLIHSPNPTIILLYVIGETLLAVTIFCS